MRGAKEGWGAFIKATAAPQHIYRCLAEFAFRQLLVTHMTGRTKLDGVPANPQGAGIYAIITTVSQGVTVTAHEQDANGDVFLLTDEIAGSDASAVSIINAQAAAAGVAADKVHIQRRPAGA